MDEIARLRSALVKSGMGFYQRALEEYCDELRAAGHFADHNPRLVTVDPADDPKLQRLVNLAAEEAAGLLMPTEEQWQQIRERRRRHEGRQYAAQVVVRARQRRSALMRLRLQMAIRDRDV